MYCFKVCCQSGTVATIFFSYCFIYVSSCCFGGALNRCGTVELINTVCCSMSICFYKFDVSYIPIVLYLHVLHHH